MQVLLSKGLMRQLDRVETAAQEEGLKREAGKHIKTQTTTLL